jgi:hypothetical protein
MLLQQGRSYLWLFAVFAAPFLGSIAFGHERWGMPAMLLFLVFVLCSELRSQVALDSWWRATHSKGTARYYALITWHTIGIGLFAVMSYLFVSSPA